MLPTFLHTNHRARSEGRLRKLAVCSEQLADCFAVSGWRLAVSGPERSPPTFLHTNHRWRSEGLLRKLAVCSEQLADLVGG